MIFALRMLFITTALITSTKAMAWSDFVHRQICDQAYERLSPKAKQMVLSLTKGEHQIESDNSFGAACIWPDEVRRTTHKATYEYHFINVPQDEELDFARDCAAYDCVNQAVKRYAIYLTQQRRRPEQRAEALRFLGHFVGDLHQPLHVGNKEDRGGNDIHIFWLKADESERLHGLWDGTIPREMGMLDPNVLAQWMGELTESQVASWSEIDIDAWARESFTIARESVYRSPDGKELMNSDRLNDAYYQQAKQIVKRRIQQSVVRLSAMLEKAATE